MARKPNVDRMQDVYSAVQRYPGEKPGFFARLLGLQRSDVTRILPTLEDRGYYLSEDDRGGLWPFKHKKP